MGRFRGTCVALVIAWAGVAAPVRAQAPAPAADAPLTLDAAVARALAANPDLAAARLRGAVTAAGISVAGERPNPEASVELTRETPKQALGVAVPLELGGKRGRRIAVSQASAREVEAEVAATLADVRNAVRRAYFDALVADLRVALLGELRDLARRVSDAARARFDAGDAPRLEVLQGGLALAAADAEVLAATGEAAAARTRLNALLGQPLGLRDVLVSPLDGGTPLEAGPAVALAAAANADIQLADRRIDEARARVRLAEALRVPDLTPTASLTHDSQPEFTYGWRAGAAVIVPVLTTHKAGLLLEQATLTQTLAEREATGRRVTAEVVAAASTAVTQRDAYFRYRDEIVPSAVQVEQLAQDSYALGQTGLPALLQALQASRDVRLRALDAAAQFQASLADLERAIGAPLP